MMQLKRKIPWQQASLWLGCVGFSPCLWAVENTVLPTSSTVIAPASAEACAGIELNAARLECYDALFKAPAPIASDPVVSERRAAQELAPEAENLKDRLLQKASNALSLESAEISPNHSLMDSRWELSPESKLGTWNVRAYKPVYLMPAFWSSDKNTQPQSLNPNNSVSSEEVGYLSSLESKFQLSLKTKAVENIIGNNGDIWLGYTQSSRWQVYNPSESRPFRETNYEPEASLVFRTNYDVFGLNWRMLGLSLNHQSNGRSDPWSRSWNRVMLNFGFDQGNFALMLRPWYRLSEERDKDNNPEIENYMGRGDLTAFYRWQEHDFSLMLRHSLKGGEDSRGAMQFDWTFPISGRLRGHLHLFDGYGESLIDYNHRATYVGLGVSLLNWF